MPSERAKGFACIMLMLYLQLACKVSQYYYSHWAGGGWGRGLVKATWWVCGRHKLQSRKILICSSVSQPPRYISQIQQWIQAVAKYISVGFWRQRSNYIKAINTQGPCRIFVPGDFKEKLVDHPNILFLSLTKESHLTFILHFQMFLRHFMYISLVFFSAIL